MCFSFAPKHTVWSRRRFNPGRNDISDYLGGGYSQASRPQLLSSKDFCCISTWQLCSGNSYTALHKFQVCCHCPTQVGSSRAPGLICFKSIHFLGSVLKISTLAHYHLLGILKKNHCFQWPKVNITYALLIKAYLQNKLMPCTRGYKAYSV